MIITIKQPYSIYELGHRSNQEDFLYPSVGSATADSRLFILCDGMGGHEHGEVASKTIALALAEFLNQHADYSTVIDDNTLYSALQYAYSKIDVLDDGADRKMGTTLCLLLFHRGGATVMHVGDSRIYHIQTSSNRILYQSRDHSLVYDLYQSGEITADEMRTSPQKNILTRAIQPGVDNRVNPSVVHITNICSGDYFFICSDGMMERMDNQKLLNILCRNSTDRSKNDCLIGLTKDNQDNHSSWLIHINNVESESNDKSLVDDESSSSDNAISIKTKPKDNSDDVEIVRDSRTKMVQPLKENRLSKFSKVIIAVLLLVIAFLIIILLKPKGTSTEMKIKSNSQPSIYYKEESNFEEGVKMRTIERPNAANGETMRREVGNRRSSKDSLDNKKGRIPQKEEKSSEDIKPELNKEKKNIPEGQENNKKEIRIDNQNIKI